MKYRVLTATLLGAGFAFLGAAGLLVFMKPDQTVLTVTPVDELDDLTPSQTYEIRLQIHNASGRTLRIVGVPDL